MDPFEEPFPSLDAASSPNLPDSPDSGSHLKGSYSSLALPPARVERNTAKLDALHKMISARTSCIDASSKEKEKEIEAEAKCYIQTKKAEHEAAVTAARAENKKLQAAKTEQLKEHKKSDAIWRNISIMLDLSKPNKFSKNTERMRSVLLTMSQKNSDAVTS